MKTIINLEIKGKKRNEGHKRIIVEEHNSVFNSIPNSHILVCWPNSNHTSKADEYSIREERNIPHYFSHKLQSVSN